MKNVRSYFLFFLTALFCQFYGNAQSAWVLKKDKDSIKVYSRASKNSNFKELKVELTLRAKLSDLAALILDIENYPKWTFNSKLTYLLKRVSNSELIFYSEIDSPWPADDRDLIVHLRILQNPLTKVMTITEDCLPDYMPPKKDIVRVPLSKEIWTVTPIDKANIKIDYFLEIDPGASAPAWLVNMFSTKGPYETFSRLKVQIQKPKYQHAVVPFITN